MPYPEQSAGLPQPTTSSPLFPSLQPAPGPGSIGASMPDFVQAVMAALAQDLSESPPIHSLHEGYAVLLAELEAFWAEVRQPPAARREGTARQALVRVAALAWRIVLDEGQRAGRG